MDTKNKKTDELVRSIQETVQLKGRFMEDTATLVRSGSHREIKSARDFKLMALNFFVGFLTDDSGRPNHPPIPHHAINLIVECAVAVAVLNAALKSGGAGES